jgi:Ca2+-binding EF-hand superfamily protein
VLDNDGDGYLSENDLHLFLTKKIKYQERELSMVRLQKLMKLMDGYKHGRISYLDWNKLIN